MSDVLNNITTLATVGVIGFVSFIGYSIYKDVEGGKFGYKDEETVGEGARCVDNGQCSSTGIAGGKSVGPDLLGLQDYGCCSGRCREKVIGIGGIKGCPGVKKSEEAGYSILPGLNELAPNGECSATGAPGKELARPGNNPLNIHVCDGRCQAMVDSEGNLFQREQPEGAEMYCPAAGEIQFAGREYYDEGHQQNTGALGHVCNRTSDCSYSGLPGEAPSDGTCISCISGRCNYNDPETGPSCVGNQAVQDVSQSSSGASEGYGGMSEYVAGNFRNTYQTKTYF